MSVSEDQAAAKVLPKYYRLRASLLEELSSGRFRPGDRFYSRNELVERCGMSGVTVQKALDLLVSEGLLAAEQGRGTFVAALPDTPRHLTLTEDGFLGLLIGDVDPTTPMAM